MNVLDTALALAGEGIPVFPCCLDKRPATSHGFKDASLDLKEIQKLWASRAAVLIGVPTGAISGLDALDIDPRHAGDKWFEAHQGRLPLTRTHRTRSGGLHLLFKHRIGMCSSAGKIAPGVDVRGDGGYVIWWPGFGGAVDTAIEPAPWPSWLSEFLLRPRRTAWTAQEGGGVAAAGPPLFASASPGSAVRTRSQRAVINALLRVQRARPGQRHDQLRAAAVTLGGVMAVIGMDGAQAESLLLDALRRGGWPAMDERKDRATIAWGLERGRQAPLVFGGA